MGALDSVGELVLVDLLILALKVMGVTIWVGLWRGWTNLDIMHAEAALAVPWLAIAVILMRGGNFPTAITPH